MGLLENMIFPSLKKTLGTELDRIEYSIVKYIKYDYPDRADFVKKNLELNIVEQYLDSMSFAGNGQLRSLDIGCATGRYPQFFANRGFFAVGYDVNDTAIEVCRKKINGGKNIKIAKKNILYSPVEPDTYSVITSMMGTFNHIEKNDQFMFLKWIFDSLKKGGRFIFSCWNPLCPYLDYLRIYDREDLEFINKNMLAKSEIELLLPGVGLSIEDITHFCFLPDTCYESWMGELDFWRVIEFDDYLRSSISPRNSQMFILHTAKV